MPHLYRGGDVENPYMRKGAPGSGNPASLPDRIVKEVKTNWWLWGSIVFAVLLVGSLVVFRENLYDSAKHGLPFLAGLPLKLLLQSCTTPLLSMSTAQDCNLKHLRIANSFCEASTMSKCLLPLGNTKTFHG